jgi:hypothetical protein
MSTDGLRIYMRAIDGAFREDVDFGMINQVYKSASGGRYSAAAVISAGAKSASTSRTKSTSPRYTSNIRI